MVRVQRLACVIGPALAATLWLPAPAAAQISEQTFRGGRTGDLATLCAAPETEVQGVAARAWCQGFIVSAGQYHGALAAADPARERVYCLPSTSDLTLDQVRTAFVAWAQAHPEYANEKAIDGLMRFAAATWPCPAATATRSGR
ncbi:MAG TPA: Rap1a/Tai family immunity protein [Crenalkalicoccus sp.]|jgi:hypothetical protein|nr:Rap1a/Tai family immunity protein [Crenalkalicoccus sp.]